MSEDCSPTAISASAVKGILLLGDMKQFIVQRPQMADNSADFRTDSTKLDSDKDSSYRNEDSCDIEKRH
jgi:hypothetical protein